MTETTRITYLFDPLCGWCYGASPTIKALAEQPGLAVDLMPTGLFSNPDAPLMDAGFAAYAWANDQRIAKLTGQTFSAEYRTQVLADRTKRMDSGPATLALTAVAMTAPARELDALQAIQAARYVEGRDITSPAVLAQILRDLSLTDAAGRLQAAAPDLLAALRDRVKAADAKMHQFGLNGVPALLVEDGQSQRLIPSGALFGDTNLVAQLTNGESLRH